jgi:hypothetical protein
MTRSDFIEYACPDCGGKKGKTSKRCQACDRASRHGDPRYAAAGRKPSSHSVWAIGRRESIITFGRGSEVRTLHCIGANSSGQIAHGRSRLDGEGWEVLCRSTPQSILADLHVPEMSDFARSVRQRTIANKANQ